MKKEIKQNTKIENLKEDIKKSEKFFGRTGESIKEAYELLDENIAGRHGNIETVFLCIPGDIQDVHDIYLN